MSANRPNKPTNKGAAAESRPLENKPVPAAGKSAPAPTPAPSVGPVPPLFRRIDWFTFGVTALLVFLGYWWTLAPDLTLEDSGELAVASLYAGVPHPPGYPVWTIFTWFRSEERRVG